MLTNFADQDAGCVSYGVEVDSCRWFVKHGPTGAPGASLERTLELHRAVSHRAIIARVAAATTRSEVTVCSPWAEGEVLYQSTRHHRPQ